MCVASLMSVTRPKSSMWDSTLGAIGLSLPRVCRWLASKQLGCVPYRAPDAGFHAIKLDTDLANILLSLTHNAAKKICAAMDMFVVKTIGFDLLYGLVIVQLARRELVWINVTAHPTAEWIAQQIVEAFPWNEAPRYLIARSRCDLRCSGQAPIKSHGHP